MISSTKLIPLLPFLGLLTFSSATAVTSSGHALHFSWGPQVALAKVGWQSANKAQVDARQPGSSYEMYYNSPDLSRVGFVLPWNGPEELGWDEGLTEGVYENAEGVGVPVYVLSMAMLFKPLDPADTRYWTCNISRTNILDAPFEPAQVEDRAFAFNPEAPAWVLPEVTTVANVRTECVPGRVGTSLEEKVVAAA